MTQQKYSDADLKFFSPKKDDDGNYKVTIKTLTTTMFNTKNVNVFCTSHKLWNDFLSNRQSTK